MRYIILLGFLLHLSLFASMEYWQIKHIETEVFHPKRAILVTVDVHKIKDALLQAPLVESKNTTPIHLDFPTPLGELIAFEIVETPVMPEKLVAKFPDIRTFTGRGVGNPNDRVSITLNKNKLKVLIIGSKGNIFTLFY